MARKQTLGLVMMVNMGLMLMVMTYCHAHLKDSYSKLQYGYRLDRKMIDSFVGFSILDCAEECLRTTRCKSMSYYKGANYCEINYENKSSAADRFLESPGWTYSEKEDWDINIVSSCSASNCSIDEKCKPLPMGKFKCVLSDCGLPSQNGLNLSSVGRWEGIGIERFMKLRCSKNCKQSGSPMFICQPNGQWKTNLNCECRDGWVPFEDHWYRLYKDRHIQFAAKNHCRGNATSYLVEINSSKENSWINNTFMTEFDNCSYNWQCSIWIGAHQVGSKTIAWSASNKTIEFSNWRPSEPIFHDNDEICVLFTKEGNLNAVECSEERWFVCEKNN